MSAAITPELRWHAIGRRKLGIARVYLTPGSGKWSINGRTLGDYFPRPSLVSHIQQPFTATDTLGRYDGKANVDGGGSTGQAGALRLAVARALVQVDEAHRRKLRDLGLLTRDARAVATDGAVVAREAGARVDAATFDARGSGRAHDAVARTDAGAACGAALARRAHHAVAAHLDADAAARADERRRTRALEAVLDARARAADEAGAAERAAVVDHLRAGDEAAEGGAGR